MREGFVSGLQEWDDELKRTNRIGDSSVSVLLRSYGGTGNCPLSLYKIGENHPVSVSVGFPEIVHTMENMDMNFIRWPGTLKAKIVEEARKGVALISKKLRKYWSQMQLRD